MTKERIERNRKIIDNVLESAELERKLLNDLREKRALTNMDIELAKTQISNNKNVVSAILADMHIARAEEQYIEIECNEEKLKLTDSNQKKLN